MKNLSEKVAVITGGASGIGLAMATKFADEGMKLALVDVEEGALDQAVRRFEEAGVDVLGQNLDVSDAESMDRLADRVLDHFGAVHVVCNNAGVGSGGLMWELTTEDWEFSLRPNLWGVIHGIRVFGRHLVAQDEGHIVNTASMAGLVSMPGMGPYNVTKHGVVTLSETLHHELTGLGSQVGVSVLCPGHVNTRIWESERNRPEELSNTSMDYSSSDADGTSEMYRKQLEVGMSADDVAARVHAAVLDGTFYIHTHTNHRKAVKERMQAIMDGDHPAMPEEGHEVFAK
jgi:NAD(P)-dependent dehydrogenase (short-subunit alcohol dehydrogenase family)